MKLIKKGISPEVQVRLCLSRENLYKVAVLKMLSSIPSFLLFRYSLLCLFLSPAFSNSVTASRVIRQWLCHSCSQAVLQFRGTDVPAGRSLKPFDDGKQDEAQEWMKRVSLVVEEQRGLREGGREEEENQSTIVKAIVSLRCTTAARFSRKTSLWM